METTSTFIFAFRNVHKSTGVPIRVRVLCTHVQAVYEVTRVRMPENTIGPKLCFFCRVPGGHRITRGGGPESSPERLRAGDRLVNSHNTHTRA